MKHLLKITSAVLVLLLCALGGVFLWRSGFFAALSSQQALQDYISQFAPYSHLCFFLLQFLSVVLAPIPSNLSAAAGGMLFGTWPSFFSHHRRGPLRLPAGLSPGTRAGPIFLRTAW